VKYAIRFDFPEAPGEPVFAGWVEESGGRSLGYAPTLKTAALWDEEEIAQRHLQNGYGPSMRECGTVVEVPA
jgi:hypothetical protein